MANEVDKIIMCPLCLDTMSTPILQCETGHSFCGDCITANSITICPTCRGPMSKTRNYQLEQIIEKMPKNLKAPCFFANQGCKYLLLPTEKRDHEVECKNRKFSCEGKKFAKWKCEWNGSFAELEQHFKQVHRSNMEYKMQKDMEVNLNRDFRDVQIISLFNGSQYFWYKFMVDVTHQKVYWVFQFIGPNKEAKNYYYEFEISDGPVRKFKITEICDNDVTEAETLFKEERCVTMSFTAVKNYMNNAGKLPVKFRIMSIKKREASK